MKTASPLQAAIEALIDAEVQQRMQALQAAQPGRRMSVAEAAAATGRAESTIYAMVSDGRLPRVPTGTNRVEVLAADVERLMTETS